MAIPKFIHQTWKDDNIPAHFRLLADTWKSHHPEWTYILWTDDMCHRFIAEHYPEMIDRIDSFKYNIQRVDAVRYFILLHHGGVYVDLDFECLHNIEPLLQDAACVMGKEPAAHCAIHQKDMIISNAFMACTPLHPFMKSLCGEVTHFDMQDEHCNDYVLSTTGPFMLTRIYKEDNAREQVRLLESEDIYPLTKEEIDRVLNDDVDDAMQQKINQAYGIHYYWGTWWKHI